MAIVRSSRGVRLDGSTTAEDQETLADSRNPWHALWALMVGYFMVVLDSTVVAVANPSIMASLHTGYSTVIWVTSAYLLASTVPLLTAGRLGDRFGAKNMYLIGLAVFAAASWWCGASDNINMLIVGRVLQGVGAALITPQTLSTITQIFPPQRRGVALSAWGATAGVALLVGPFAGGALLAWLGWQWIFLVNVPIAVVGLGLAAWLIPAVPTCAKRFDVVGLGLSGVGMFLVVFALQEAQPADWAMWIWMVLVAGLGFFAAFVYWQSINAAEPLVPLQIFGKRDFAMSTLGVVAYGFVVTAMCLPTMFFAQLVLGFSPVRAALLCSPMPIAACLLAPVVGRIVDKFRPRPILGSSFSLVAVALVWLAIELLPTTPIWRLVLPSIALGVGLAFTKPALAATATRNLSPNLVGASSGVYTAARNLGALLGSATMAAFIASRTAAEMPSIAGGSWSPSGLGGRGIALQLTESLREPFASVMSHSLLVLAFVALIGTVAAMFIVD
jgi:EmrB/QacA subfamily drug resistance transporter